MHELDEGCWSPKWLSSDALHTRDRLKPSSEVGEGGREGKGSTTVEPSSEVDMTDDDGNNNAAVEFVTLNLIGFGSPSAQSHASQLLLNENNLGRRFKRDSTRSVRSQHLRRGFNEE